MILKHFFDKNEMKFSGENENHLKNLKPLINRILEDLGLQQGKAIDAHQQKQSMDLEMVYSDPKKRYHEIFTNTKDNILNPFETKEFETIKSALAKVQPEVDTGQDTVGDAAKKTPKSETGQIITFALPLREENHSGKLRIYYARKSKNGPKEGFKMSLLLQMEKIGDIRTDFFLLNKDLKITFYINDHKIKKIITAHADLIKKPLTEHFSHLILDVVVSERKIEEFKIEHLISENTSLLDLRV